MFITNISSNSSPVIISSSAFLIHRNQPADPSADTLNKYFIVICVSVIYVRVHATNNISMTQPIQFSPQSILSKK